MDHRNQRWITAHRQHTGGIKGQIATGGQFVGADLQIQPLRPDAAHLEYQTREQIAQAIPEDGPCPRTRQCRGPQAAEAAGCKIEITPVPEQGQAGVEGDLLQVQGSRIPLQIKIQTDQPGTISTGVGDHQISLNQAARLQGGDILRAEQLSPSIAEEGLDHQPFSQGGIGAALLHCQPINRPRGERLELQRHQLPIQREQIRQRQAEGLILVQNKTVVSSQLAEGSQGNAGAIDSLPAELLQPTPLVDQRSLTGMHRGRINAGTGIDPELIGLAVQENDGIIPITEPQGLQARQQVDIAAALTNQQLIAVEGIPQQWRRIGLQQRGGQQVGLVHNGQPRQLIQIHQSGIVGQIQIGAALKYSAAVLAVEAGNGSINARPVEATGRHFCQREIEGFRSSAELSKGVRGRQHGLAQEPERQRVLLQRNRPLADEEVLFD